MAEPENKQVTGQSQTEKKHIQAVTNSDTANPPLQRTSALVRFYSLI